MRTRKELEADIENWPIKHRTHEMKLLEVLLDIRDLLSKDKEPPVLYGVMTESDN